MNSKFIVNKTETGLRVDKFLFKKFSILSREKIKKQITSNVLVNGKQVKPSHKIKSGDIVIFNFTEKQIPKIEPKKVKLNKIYEDNNLLIINKPDNLVVHPTPNNNQETLVNYLIAEYPEIINVVQQSSDIEKLRPGIVHRLDKDTTGIIIVAKNKKSLKYLTNEFKKHRVEKTYYALVYSWPPESGELTSRIIRDKKNRTKMTEGLTGKLAISHYFVQHYYQTKNDKDKLALVKINIQTGRTHQIRLQFKKFGFPVLGDKKYFTKESRILSQKLAIKRQMLHAGMIKFKLQSGEEIEKSANLPEDFIKIVKQLKIILD